MSPSYFTSQLLALLISVMVPAAAGAQVIAPSPAVADDLSPAAVGAGAVKLPESLEPAAANPSTATDTVVRLDLGRAAETTVSQDQGLHAAAFEYSDGYRLRNRIHKIASFATLPLFVADLAVGQSLYSSTSSDTSNRRGLHAALGAGIGGLFAVNTVTGTWNLFGEARQDPNHRALRLVHGLLMMAADAGFVAAAQSAPGEREERGFVTSVSDKSTHRNIAVASISLASASYLMMIFGNH
jgi:hypothetical protein